jgi:signal transduction histidine kinase/ligand-binding sensor domain-containing protein/CheY-like chemotaxis protein
MWFGTWNGLNRFDGYNFIIYKSEIQGHSLSNNFVYSICEDKNGNIWVGTKNGLNILDYPTNQFINLFHDPNNNNSIASNRINTVYCDHKGMIWVGTADSGLDRITLNKNDEFNFRVIHFKNNASDPGSLPGNEISHILEDHLGNIWVGTNQGLGKLNAGTGKFKVYRNIPGNFSSLSINTVLAIYEDKSGYIWVGTTFGLNRLDPKTELFTQFLNNQDDPKSISHSTVNAIAEDLDGNLLIGTLGGLDRYNKDDHTFYRFAVNQNGDYSLNNEFVNVLYTDKEGNVWIGTDKGGVNKYNTYQKEFGYFAHHPDNPNSLSNNTINSVLEEQHVLWVGTAGGGLNEFDRNTKTFKYYKNIPHKPSSINSNFITSVIRDNKQNLWIGTWGGGLDKMISPNGDGSFKHFINTNNPSSICSSFISSIWQDESGFMLVGTLGGIDLFYPGKEGAFRHIANNPDWKNRITEVGCILKDKRGTYWIGTRYGLYKVSADKLKGKPEDTDFTHYVNIAGNQNSLPGNYIISLCEDHKGNIWVGTYGNGISKIQVLPNNHVQFSNYTQTDGLCNNVVYAILEDNNGVLWLSTDNGLSRFDPKQTYFKNFFVTDGLQSNQFYWSAAYKSKEGRLYFGGIKGLNFFYPDSIRDNPFTPKVAITDFKIYNNTVNIGLWNNKKVILTKIINETNKIDLSYKENVFSFEFSALDYFLPEKAQYQYKMEGVDQDWVTVPASRRFVTYTNLKGGDYTFWLKASNSDGVWSNEPTKLKIHISPPFWATLWFRILSSIMLLLSIFGYFKVRTMRLEIQKRILEETVKERTAKIEEQKEELRIQAEHLIESNSQLAQRQELIEGQKAQLEQQNLEISEQRDKLIELNKRVQLINQLKLRFFTNISHEFRTPLTLILGPLDKLISSWKGDKDTQGTLELINRNAQRLLHLINQLMEFRKAETGKLDLKVSQGDMEKFLENIFSSFQHLANQRNITYTYHRSGLKEKQWFDHEKIENIVYNLLSNAFKFTPENGKISLSVSCIRKNVLGPEEGKSIKNLAASSCLEIKVEDTGIGISQEHINHIFKRFYQVNSPESLKVRGSGIGLSLAKELTKAHHGQISVESSKGMGSVFSVLIPFEKNSFLEKEIINEPFVIKDNFQEHVTKLAKELLSEKTETGKSKDSPIEEKSEKPLILVIEDNFDLRSFIKESLTEEFQVIDAENGKEGYELAKVYNPDLIISDIMMPEMDGLELCSRMKNNLLTSHIPIILLTARTSVENLIEGLETGADDYIPKPFDIKILIARTKNLIESRRKLKKHFSSELAPDPSQIATSNADEQFLQKALEIVEKNFNDPTFGVEEFVEKMCISRSLLHKKLSALTEQSAGDFITSLRLKRAAQLLHLPDKNISDVAYEVGFNDPKYFSRIFRKYFGTTPTEYVNN